MKLLYITRKFPPMVGGMEQVSFALAREFRKLTDTTLITWGKSQRYLPFFYIIALLRMLTVIPLKKITHVHIGDPVLSPLGILAKTLFGVHVTITVHGLDIIYTFPGYQQVIPRFVNAYDRIICISSATMNECVKRGITKEKCMVIPCGVYASDRKVASTIGNLERITGKLLKKKKIVVTVGRLVARKGAYWFIKHVFTKLDANTIYLVIGEGPDYQRIASLINEMNLSDRVLLLGRLSDREVKIVYDTADVFVMPNIPEQGNFEGFGIVALEASASGLPVVAAKTDGIPQAVVAGKTGLLVHPRDADAFAKSITKAMKPGVFDQDEIIRTVKKMYNWPDIAMRYIQTFSSVS